MDTPSRFLGQTFSGVSQYQINLARNSLSLSTVEIWNISVGNEPGQRHTPSSDAVFKRQKKWSVPKLMTCGGTAYIASDHPIIPAINQYTHNNGMRKTFTHMILIPACRKVPIASRTYGDAQVSYTQDA